MNVHPVGARVRVWIPGLGLTKHVATVTGGPELLGLVIDERSDWYGLPPDTVVQRLDAPGNFPGSYCAYPPVLLIPVDDEGESGRRATDRRPATVTC